MLTYQCYRMNWFCLIVWINVFIVLKLDENSCANKHLSLVRRKRYLVFPEGASLSVAICLTAQTTLPAEFFTEAINWGIAYDLPNETTAIRNFFYSKHIAQRRHRRDLYQKIEVIMDSMGFNGRSCVLRALCEASRKFLNNHHGLIEELIRIVFNFPLQRIMNWEPEEHRIYHWAYRIGKDEESRDCSQLFSDCPFSLIAMALGEYST